MPNGKLPDEPCIHLDDDLRCRIFLHADRPKVCASLQPSQEMCGTCRDDAMSYLRELERITAP